MRILAVDLGSCLGMAWREGGHVRTRAAKLPRGEQGLRVLRFAWEVRQTLRSLEPDAVAYELPEMLRGWAATRCLFALEAVLLLACEEAKIPYSFVRVRAAKEALAGLPTASKGEMVAAAAARYGLVGVTHDEADAVGVLLAAEGVGGQ